MGINIYAVVRLPVFPFGFEVNTLGVKEVIKTSQSLGMGLTRFYIIGVILNSCCTVQRNEFCNMESRKAILKLEKLFFLVFRPLPQIVRPRPRNG